MRIAIDARELSGRPTGVGRYLSGLVRQWTAPQARPPHEFLLYAHQPFEISFPAPVRVLPGRGGTLWEQQTLPAAMKADGVDVLFSPAYSTPLLTHIPRVVALHDISFVARPDWFRWREGLRRRVLARRSAAAARAIVTISDFSKSEIVNRLGADASRIHVIPPGIDAPAAPVTRTDQHDRAQVLYVGSIFNRRHIPDLIDAFTRVATRHPDASLNLVGDNRSYPFQDVPGLIARSTAHERIRWHRYAADAELQQLYRQAGAFVFLSEYEGLGLTPLEALSAGIPSLLLDTPVARESCGAAALYVTLDSIDEVATRLERLLYDRSTRDALLAEAPAVLAKYDWARAARETLLLLEGAA